MNCRQAKRQMSASLDRDLTFQQEGVLQKHLRDCPPCTAEMARLESVRDLLAGLPESDPGPNFYEDIRQRIDAASRSGVREPEQRRVSLVELFREAFGAAWLRPALGVAFGLGIGIVIGTVAIEGPGTPSPSMGGPVADESFSGPRVDREGPGGNLGPVADIDIDHFAAASDTLDADATISILDPYYQHGPQGELSPVVGRSPNDGRDAQARRHIF